MAVAGVVSNNWSGDGGGRAGGGRGRLIKEEAYGACARSRPDPGNRAAQAGERRTLALFLLSRRVCFGIPRDGVPLGPRQRRARRESMCVVCEVSSRALTGQGARANPARARPGRLITSRATSDGQYQDQDTRQGRLLASSPSTGLACKRASEGRSLVVLCRARVFCAAAAMERRGSASPPGVNLQC